jgi:hypothetical protein
MIEPDVFVERMAELADRFNRPLHEQTQRRYYELLNREITTEEFIGAAELAFRNSSFWPSPKELIEFIHPPRDLTLEASQAFDKMLALGEPHPMGTCWLRSKIVDEIGEPAAVAFSAIGAQGRLRGITTDDLPWARREFIAAYKASAVDTSHAVAAREALRFPQQQRMLAERAG